jgi:hypothetical protein
VAATNKQKASKDKVQQHPTGQHTLDTKSTGKAKKEENSNQL